MLKTFTYTHHILLEPFVKSYTCFYCHMSWQILNVKSCKEIEIHQFQNWASKRLLKLNQKSREISKIFQKLLMRGCAGINILEKLRVFTTHIYQQVNSTTRHLEKPMKISRTVPLLTPSWDWSLSITPETSENLMFSVFRGIERHQDHENG